MVPNAAAPPVSLMVLRDHDISGPVVAFFKESMRRDAMIGTRIVFTLWDPS